MEHYEVNYGRKRRNDWKWKSKIDEEVEFYKNKKCECGCGGLLNPSRKTVRNTMWKKRIIRCLRGHTNRLPIAKIRRGKNHPFYGKHHTKKSLEKMSMKTKGKNHPCWKGGITKPFPFRRGWESIRIKVLKRDDYTCQICKKSKKESLLHVHHKISRRKFSIIEEAHNLTNLVTLCKQCHLTLENRLKSIKNRANSGNVQNGQPPN